MGQETGVVVFMGGVNLLFKVVAMMLADKLGRKPLTLIGAGGLAIIYVIVAQLLSTHSSNISWFFFICNRNV